MCCKRYTSQIILLLILTVQAVQCSGRAKLSERLAKSICKQTENFAYSENIQPALDDSGQFAEFTKCKNIRWRKCEIQEQGESSACEKFESLQEFSDCSFKEVEIQIHYTTKGDDQNTEDSDQVKITTENPPNIENETMTRITTEAPPATGNQIATQVTTQNPPADGNPTTAKITTEAPLLTGNQTTQETPQMAGRSVGGRKAKPHELPYQVRFFNPTTRKTFCGGAIINPLYLLSAAHCFLHGEHQNMITYVGGRSISGHDKFEKTVKVVKVLKHEQYNPKTFMNDIALLKLSKPIRWSESIKPALIPKDKSKPKGYATVLGWRVMKNKTAKKQPGIIQNIKKLAIVTNAVCQNSFRATQIDVTKLCARYIGKGGMDFCQGNSGGPLTQHLKNGSFLLIGVASAGVKCTKKAPGVYTDVAQFRDWIVSRMNV